MTLEDGRSGASLQRVTFADGTTRVTKRASPGRDVVMRLTRDATGREFELWRSGVLDRVPHTIIDAWREDGETVVVMRDIADQLVGWNRRLSRDDVARLMRAMAELHASFADGPRPAGLCDLDVRVRLLGPPLMRTEDHELARLVLRGWEHFRELVGPSRAAPVLALLEDPSPLASRLSERRSTLLHGDLFPPNVALTTDGIVLIDWTLATWGPPAIDVVTFLTGGFSQIDAGREDVLADVRAAYGDAHDEDALGFALVFGLLELGWNKALDAVEHEDAAKRATERADLEWWLRAAEPGLRELGYTSSRRGSRRRSGR